MSETQKIEIVKNTLKAVVETWDDPGDYPSGAGAGPLPSYDYVEEINGFVEVEVTFEQLLELFKEEPEPIFFDVLYELAREATEDANGVGIKSVKWQIKDVEMPNFKDRKILVRLEVESFEE